MSSSVIKNISQTKSDEKFPAVIIAWLDRLIILWLFVMALAAPHSIAATQSAWLLGMLCWTLRFALRPRPRVYRTPVDYALLGFFILTGLSAFLSYEPMVSIGKLRAASLFTIVYLVAENVPSRRVLRALALTLVASCSINVVYTLGQRIVGRGVKVENLSTASPLYIAGIREGDTLLEVEGRTLHNPDELFNALSTTNSEAAHPSNSSASGTTRTGEVAQPGSVLLKYYRLENYWTNPVLRGHLLDGETPLARLGIGSWMRGRDWR